MPCSRRAGALVPFAILTFASRLGAQCPDGAPPPCPAQASAARPAPIDLNRIAVLPFRVTTADTLLGEGFAELLAPEFTGEGGPRSIDMSTTLSAWRRAGGGLRSPLPQEAASKLARDIGAGLLCQGSIVGFGGRLTVSAGLFDATSGRAIGVPARAAGPPDSVDVLLRRVATDLLSAAGATTRVSEAARLTSSLPALRLYLEGLALWRRGRWDDAERAFTKSYELDTTFASPAYQAYRLTSQTGRGAAWQRRTIALRDRLPPRERTVVEELYMPGTGAPAERHAARRRVAERLVDSPDAWFSYGDAIYHGGHSVYGPDSALTVALAAFNRAMALDPMPVYMYHLMESAVYRRDTVAARRMLVAYGGVEGEEGWTKKWVLAASLGDAAFLTRLRQRAPDTVATLLSTISLASALDSRIPVALVDEAYRRLEPLARGNDLHGLRLYHAFFHLGRGRPAAAEVALGAAASNIFRAPIIWAYWVSGDAAEDAAVLSRYASAPQTDSVSEGRRQCVGAVVRAAQGQADSVDVAALRLRVSARCVRLLEAWKQFAAGTVTDSLLSGVENFLDGSGYTNFLGYEHRLLARMYESRGDYARAFAAVSRYPRDYRGAWLAPTLREVGRLALLAGDTTRAVRSYEHYLELRAEAEPRFVAERDSVRAIVARLRR